MVNLEELGLYYMLERIHANSGSTQDIVRVGLRGDGLIDGDDPPKLTEAGRDKLQALRMLVDASNESNAARE